MNAETQIVIDRVEKNLEYWRATLDFGRPLWSQLRDALGANVTLPTPGYDLYAYAIDKVDWPEVAKCIPTGIHLRDAKEGQDYVVRQSYSLCVRNGATIRVHKRINYMHLEIEGVGCSESFSNADIPVVWLVEKAVEEPMTLRDAGDGLHEVVASRAGFEVGELITVRHWGNCTTILRGHTYCSKTCNTANLPNVEVVKVKEAMHLSCASDGEYRVISGSRWYRNGEIIYVKNTC